jgi:asparagine synthase (glutamine-hydrolysing)
MCGICGLLGKDAPDPGLVERMNASIVHRGPDHSAVESFGRAVLGYRRLSIVDLSTGDQPVASEAGDVVAVFNGEIYNFRELRAELEAKGHAIRGTGDSPLIPHAYEEWGRDFVGRLEGMFAIALWDRRSERLMLVRDRLGKKPLVYAELPDGSVAFASETKALLRLPTLRRDLDLEQIDAYLALQYAPRSGLSAVQKVPAGSYVVAENGRLRTVRYWEPRPDDAEGGEPTPSPARDEWKKWWLDRVRTFVENAVARRMVADVPLGALLSGGIDSSIVVAAMARASSRPVRTFTVGFADPRYDERAYARAVAERYGTEHEEVQISPDPNDVQRIAEAFDEPFGDEAALPTLLVCEATRRHVKVALVGDGGDEVFGGYERYRAHALAERIPGHAAALGANALGRIPQAKREPRSTLFRARRFLDAAATPGPERYASLVEVFPLALRRRLWTDEALAHATSSYLPADDDLRLVDMESYLPGDLLPKADLASMAVSLELRSPFLDHRVVELGLALPPELAAGKTALKQAFADDLPPEIAGRGKTGFGVPLDRWFREELRPLAHDLLLGGEDRGLFRRAELKRLLDEHVGGRADHGHRLWCLCMLELWQRTHVDLRRPALATA